MKKKLILIAGIAIALAACTKNELRDDSTTTEPVSWPSVITVATEPVVDSETKSVIASDGTFKWFAGTGETAEKLGINTDAGFKVYTCTNAATGTFGGDLEGATPSTVAVYPAGQYALSTKTLTVTMPASYEYVATLAKTPMIAQISGSIDDLAFKHIAALLKVSVKNVPPTATQLVLETDKNIAGDFVISDCTVADAEITNDGGSGKSVAVNFPAAGTFTDMDFFIPIPVGTYAHFYLFLKDENGNKLAGRQFSGKTIARKNLASGDAISLPQLQLSDAIVLNDTQIGLRWSVSDFATTSAAITADKALDYTFGIYSDAACSSLLWEWNTAANAAKGYTSTPGHIFSGLDASTTYYVKVKSTSAGIAAVKAFTTTAAEMNFLKTDAIASVDDIVLYENFNDIIYGSDYVNQLSGVALSGWSNEIGRPDATTNKAFAGARTSDHNFLLNTHNGSSVAVTNYLKTKSLFSWTAHYGASGTTTYYPTIVAGGLRFGGSSRMGYIVSPPLESLPGTTELEVKITAGSIAEGKDLYIAVFPAGEADGANATFPSAPLSETKVATVSNGKYTEYTCTVEVSYGQRIGVGTKLDGTVTELFVDKIVAKVNSVETELVQKLVFANNSQIAVRWSETAFMEPDTDLGWSEAPTKTFSIGIYSDAECTSEVYPAINKLFPKTDKKTRLSPGYVFSNLTPNTSYWVKIVDGSLTSIASYSTTNKDLNGIQSSPASIGDVILAQDFNELTWGPGDYFLQLAGYNHLKDYDKTGPFTAQTGSSSLAITGAMNLLKGVWASTSGNPGATFISSSSLGTWKCKGTAPLTGTGYLRYDNAAYMVSPELTCLTGEATVKVSFTAAGNGASKKVNIAVFPKDATLQTNTYYLDDSVDAISTSSDINLTSEKWITYSVNIPVASGQRIGIGYASAGGFYLNDIKVELVSYD